MVNNTDDPDFKKEYSRYPSKEPSLSENFLKNVKSLSFQLKDFETSITRFLLLLLRGAGKKAGEFSQKCPRVYRPFG